MRFPSQCQLGGGELSAPFRLWTTFLGRLGPVPGAYLNKEDVPLAVNFRRRSCVTVSGRRV
jgi:hypothetical protein